MNSESESHCLAAYLAYYVEIVGLHGLGMGGHVSFEFEEMGGNSTSGQKRRM